MTETNGCRLISNGQIILYGDVGVSMPGSWTNVDGFTAAEVLFALAEIGPDQDITVRINSGGGLGYEGMAIHAILSAHKGKVTTVVEGIAASAGSLIAMAGSERIIAPGSIMMIHDPSGLTMGTAEDHDESAVVLRSLAASMATVYAAATGRPTAQIRAEMVEEIWLDADDAVAKKYATKIGTVADADAPAAVAAFPYAAYSHAPERLVAMAKAEGWSKRAFTAAHAAGKVALPPAEPKRSPEQASNDATAIRETCALAGKPELADGFIAAGKSSSDVVAQLLVAAPTATAPAPLTREGVIAMSKSCQEGGVPELLSVLLAENVPQADVAARIAEAKEIKAIVTIARSGTPDLSERIGSDLIAAGKRLPEARATIIAARAEITDRNEITTFTKPLVTGRELAVNAMRKHLTARGITPLR